MPALPALLPDDLDGLVFPRLGLEVAIEPERQAQLDLGAELRELLPR